MSLRKIFIFLVFFLALNCFGQEDSIRQHNKNQLSVYLNLYSIADNSQDTWWGIQYRRLMKKQRNDSLNHNYTMLRYWYTNASLSFNDYGLVDANNLSLVQSFDSIIEYNHLQRVSNTYSFRFGRGNQFRLASKDGAGLQATIDVFGVLGLTEVKEKFTFLYNSPGSVPTDEWLAINGITLNDALSERSAGYLRLGAGVLFGLDWVFSSPKEEKNPELIIGVQLGFDELSVGMRMYSKQKEDLDLLFNDTLDAAPLYLKPHFGLRLGVGF